MSKPKLVDLSPEEQRLFQKAWKRIRRTIHGALKNQIHCHGKIEIRQLPSAMKRVIGQLKDPVWELTNAFVERKREAEAKELKVRLEGVDYGHHHCKICGNEKLNCDCCPELEECRLCGVEKKYCTC